MSDLDVQSVQSDLSDLPKSDRSDVLTDPTSCVGEVRKSVGLSDEGVAAFRDELLAKGLSPMQAAHACRFAESVRRDGTETRVAIAQSFPRISSVFDVSSFDKVWESLKARKATAEK